MRYGKLTGAVGVLVVLVTTVGAVSTLFRGTFGLGSLPDGASTLAALATVLFVLALLVVGVVYGSRSGRWLANPYW